MSMSGGSEALARLTLDMWHEGPMRASLLDLSDVFEERIGAAEPLSLDDVMTYNELSRRLSLVAAAYRFMCN